MGDILEVLRGALQDSHMVMSEEELRALARTVERQTSDDPPAVTVYTELLQALATWSAMVDEGDISENDFAEMQGIGHRIIQGHNEGRYTGEDYRALIAVYEHVLDNARALLRP